MTPTIIALLATFFSRTVLGAKYHFSSKVVHFRRSQQTNRFLVMSNSDISSSSSLGQQSSSPKVRVNGDYLVACHTEQYDELLVEKVSKLRDLLRLDTINIEVYESPRTHFRMRANFNIWRDNPKDYTDPNNFYYAMYDNMSDNKKQPLEITSFPRGSIKINELMARLMIELKTDPDLYSSLFEVRFLTSQTDDAVIVLLYKKPISAKWEEAAAKLSTTLGMLL